MKCDSMRSFLIGIGLDSERGWLDAVRRLFKISVYTTVGTGLVWPSVYLQT